MLTDTEKKYTQSELDAAVQAAMTEADFRRAGHPPANPNCNHAGYNFQQHGRYCWTCGTCMFDPGD